MWNLFSTEEKKKETKKARIRKKVKGKNGGFRVTQGFPESGEVSVKVPKVDRAKPSLPLCPTSSGRSAQTGQIWIHQFDLLPVELCAGSTLGLA